MNRFVTEWRRRLAPHAIMIFVAWPLLSAFSATVTLKDQAVAHYLLWVVAFAGNLFAMLKMAPEFVAIGLVFYAASTILFASIASLGSSDAMERAVKQSRFLEPMLLLFAAFFGVALEYPAALRHPLVLPVWWLNAISATVILFAAVIAVSLIIGRTAAGRRGAALTVALAVGVFGLFYRIAAMPMTPPLREAAPNTIVLFGIDSLSVGEDLKPLQKFTKTQNGTWFEHAVSPGLMTNPVWTSILMHRPISETGVFLVRQPANWTDAPFTLVKRARELGYTSWSFFSDQFTTYVGSDAGFDRDCSGPRGWLQVATTGVKDSSVFLPLLLPRLPQIPLATTPRNHAGTYTFNVAAEVNEILNAGRETQGGDFVAAHLDYLHQPRYPRRSEMNGRERSLVRWTPVWDLRDPSLDFNYPHIVHDPLRLYDWKIQNVQKVIIDELVRTNFLDPRKKNRIVLLSDHGRRGGMDGSNFGDEKFYRVMLAGFGIEPRDPSKPISVLDAGELVGLTDPTHPEPFPPVVEFTLTTKEEWEALVKTAKLRWNGDSWLNPQIIAAIGARLTGYRPYGDPRGYFASPIRKSLARTESKPAPAMEAATIAE